MRRQAFAGLIKLELPAGVGGDVIRLSDGGAVRWGAETFTARHGTFGAIGGLEALEEGVGEEVPALSLVLQPPSTAAAAELVAPGNQTARVRVWLAEFDPATALVLGDPDLLFDGFLDQATFHVGRARRELALTVVCFLERLLALNIGNSLSPAWHKSVWPGETGHDQATGLGRQIAWGVEAPQAASVGVGAGGGGSGPAWRGFNNNAML